MNRKQALAAIDSAIATSTGATLDTLAAYKARMIDGWGKEDAKLTVKIAQRKKQALDWQKSIDFRPY